MITGYLDNASSTVTKFFAKDFYIPGNPNSTHAMGRKANEALKEAKERIKRALGVKGGKILFCRCASEAIEGLCKCFTPCKWNDMFYSNYEHESVYEIAQHYGDSFTTINRIADWVRPNNLCLYQYANNITGAVFDIKTVGESCREHSAFFGSDFTAVLGHVPIAEDIENFCDALWFSGHKIGAEQGIGAIWIGERVIEYFEGLGGKIETMFPGTPNVSGAVALSHAVEYATNPVRLDDDIRLWNNLANHLSYRLDCANISFRFVNPTQDYTPAINAITFPGFNADALVRFLSSRGVYISAGHSACSGDSPDAHRVLEAFGLSKKEASETVRVSFCEDSTLEEVDMLVDGILEFRNKFM